MSEKKAANTRRETLVEKLMRRSLETVGGSVDSVFGRGKKPDALPATSDLSERLRKMIDRQAQVNQDGRKLAPHLISLKYPWGQTSDEFQVALRRLKNELLIVAIDFINDNRFATLAPVKIETKADILTTGFTMSIGFDEASLRDSEAVEIPVEIYAKLLPNYQADAAPAPLEIVVNVTANLPSGGTRRSILHFIPQKKTTLTVGRIKEIDLYLDDESVSKHHASLVMSAEGVLRVADIGSTNGTFLNGTRIAYGKAYEIQPAMIVGFGDVTASFEWEIPQPEMTEPETNPDPDENAETLEANESGFKIGVKSAVPRRADQEEDEFATVSGTTSINNADEESVTINQKHDENEPETADTGFDAEPENLNKLKINEPQKAEPISGKPESGLLAETAELLPQKFEHQDFTQSLDTNPHDEVLADKSLLGFDSLVGRPNDFPKESDDLIQDETNNRG
ncbi:MAG: FHA domain-containing protein [Pyrinomonadaceae bacterium]